MAIAQTSLLSPVPFHLMTYEDYMAEGEINLRYDILDGARIMAGGSEEHQDIALNIAELFRRYQRVSGVGKTLIAPRDILISQVPLRTRQPDVMFISHTRNAQNPPRANKGAMTTAPELIVEVISDSDRAGVLEAKIADYQRLDVREGWIVRPIEQTVEVLSLTPTTVISAATYDSGQEVQSLVFPDLVVPVDAIFAE